MPIFSYRAKNQRGHEIRGDMEVASADDLIYALDARGYSLTHLYCEAQAETTEVAELSHTAPHETGTADRQGHTTASSAINDMELAIRWSKHLEAILANDFGATGRGLHSMVNSVAGQLPEPLIRHLRLVATVRNKLVHDSRFDRIENVERFMHACTEAEASLRALPARAVNTRRKATEVPAIAPRAVFATRPVTTALFARRRPRRAFSTVLRIPIRLLKLSLVCLWSVTKAIPGLVRTALEIAFGEEESIYK